MSLRTKTTLFILLAVVSIVGMVEMIHARTSLHRFRQIEDAQLLADMDRTVSHVGSKLEAMSGVNLDWAYWNDTNEFMLDGNSEYVEDNLAAEFLAPLGIDVVAFVDNGGNVIYDAWYREEGDVPVPAEILELLQPGGLLTVQPSAEDAVTGLVVADGHGFLVSTRRSLTSDYSGPSNGVLLMGRSVTADFVAHTASLTNLEIEIEPCEPATCEALTGVVQVEKTDDQLIAHTAMTGLDGLPALDLHLVENRDVYAEGAAGVRRVQKITLSAGIVAALLAIVLARSALIGRLERLNNTVADVGNLRDHTIRVAVEGNDEIATVAIAVNNMLDGLEASQDELHEAKAQVEHASEAKSRFLARVSHEVRNPLNGVIAYAQLLEMDGLEGEQAESVEQILAAGRHITELLNEFLDIARIEAGAIPLDLHPVVISDIAREALDMSRPAASERNIVLRPSGDGAIMALADPLRLRQVLLNLVSNAIKYGNEGGMVSIHLEPAGERQIIQVIDDGPGIAADQLDRLFIPFDRLDADSTSVSGTGVGLSVSKQLVELMDGSIRVESQLGAGVRFTIELPAAPYPEPTAPTEPAVVGVSASG